MHSDTYVQNNVFCGGFKALHDIQLTYSVYSTNLW